VPGYAPSGRDGGQTIANVHQHWPRDHEICKGVGLSNQRTKVMVPVGCQTGTVELNAITDVQIALGRRLGEQHAVEIEFDVMIGRLIVEPSFARRVIFLGARGFRSRRSRSGSRLTPK
jgi:hypothetical protein